MSNILESTIAVNGMEFQLEGYLTLESLTMDNIPTENRLDCSEPESLSRALGKNVYSKTSEDNNTGEVCTFITEEATISRLL